MSDTYRMRGKFKVCIEVDVLVSLLFKAKDKTAAEAVIEQLRERPESLHYLLKREDVAIGHTSAHEAALTLNEEAIVKAIRDGSLSEFTDQGEPINKVHSSD